MEYDLGRPTPDEKLISLDYDATTSEWIDDLESVFGKADCVLRREKDLGTAHETATYSLPLFGKPIYPRLKIELL